MFRRYCNNLDAKGKLVSAKDSPFKHVKNFDSDHYLSIYIYNDLQKEKFYEKITKKNKDGEEYETINGAANILEVVTDQLFIDFDENEKAGLTVDDARLDAIEALKRLERQGITEDNYRLYFSGSKGFCIQLDLNRKLSPEEHKNVAGNLLNARQLKTFDTKVYNASRIFRVPFTKHPVSGLYKIELTKEDLNLSVEEIKELASHQYEPELSEIDPISVKLKWLDTYQFKRKEVKKPTFENEAANECDLNFDKKPRYAKDLSNWKYALVEGYYPPGCRNYALLIIAATYKGLGYGRGHTYRILKGSNEIQSERFSQEKYDDEQIWKEIIEQVYGPTWSGGTYSEDHFPDELVEYLEGLGIPRSKGEDSSLICSIDEGFEKFAKYAEEADKNSIEFGIESLDKRLKTRLGHLLFVLAAPSVGKTSMAITMMNNMSKQGKGCYFGSYDMFSNNVYQKLIQRHTSISEEKLYSYFVNNDQEKIKEFQTILRQEYENVRFCFKVGQTVEDLKYSVAMEEERLGKPILLVVVDYLELVLTKASDPTAASAEAAQGLRELANEGRVVLGLLQPNKFSSTVDEPVLTYNAAKGSSSIAQAATTILTCHRPGMSSKDNNKNDYFFGINCVKNRNGPLFALDYGWDGPTQTIYELDDAARQELKDLRDKKLMDTSSDGGFW